MASDGELVGIGLALLIVAGIMWFALEGDLDASTAWRLQATASTIWSAIQTAVSAFGI
jgi:hypothetical protein